MQNEIVIIDVLLADGLVIKASLSFASDRKTASIQLHVDKENICFTGRDLWEAFCNLRRHVETEGMRLLCVGSRKDAVHSGMSRDMSGGRRIYVTKIGQHPTLSDVFDIFAYAPAETVGTLREQEDYLLSWRASLKGKLR